MWWSEKAERSKKERFGHRYACSHKQDKILQKEPEVRLGVEVDIGNETHEKKMKTTIPSNTPLPSQKNETRKLYGNQQIAT